MRQPHQQGLLVLSRPFRPYWNAQPSRVTRPTRMHSRRERRHHLLRRCLPSTTYHVGVQLHVSTARQAAPAAVPRRPQQPKHHRPFCVVRRDPSVVFVAGAKQPPYGFPDRGRRIHAAVHVNRRRRARVVIAEPHRDPIHHRSLRVPAPAFRHRLMRSRDEVGVRVVRCVPKVKGNARGRAVAAVATSSVFLVNETPTTTAGGGIVGGAHELGHHKKKKWK